MTLDTLPSTTHNGKVVAAKYFQAGRLIAGSFKLHSTSGKAVTTWDGYAMAASADANFEADMEDAKRQVRSMLPFDDLLKHAKKNPPSQEWYDEEFDA